MSTYVRNLRAKVLRALMRLIRTVRPVPSLPRAPWSPVDAFAHGLVRIHGKWYDLAFEMSFRSYAEWDSMWGDYAKDAS